MEVPKGGRSATCAQFEASLHEKPLDSDFRDDIGPQLRPGTHWDFDNSLALVGSRIIDALPGDPWNGAWA